MLLTEKHEHFGRGHIWLTKWWSPATDGIRLTYILYKASRESMPGKYAFSCLYRAERVFLLSYFPPKQPRKQMCKVVDLNFILWKYLRSNVQEYRLAKSSNAWIFLHSSWCCYWKTTSLDYLILHNRHIRLPARASPALSCHCKVTC